MKTRCPNCGASQSLDALIANDEAREALAALVALGGELSKLTVRYCGLFRPAKSELSFARLAKLLNELLPDMQNQRIERGGELFAAPPQAWVWALKRTIDQRDSNKLTTPLRSHAYLYEILSTHQPTANVASVADNNQPQTPMSKMRSGMAKLEAMKR